MNDLILKVVDIAREAGHAIMDIYNSDSFDVELKGDNSPLTIADKKANDIICQGLKSISPEIPIISEENKLMPYAVRKNWNKAWMVDPLDGTKEFIKRNGEFTVNIALIENNKSIAGVVYAPALDTMYYAIAGQGAYVWNNEEWLPLQCSKFKSSDESLKIVCSRSHLNEETKGFVNNYNKPILIAKGSSLKFLIMAEQGAELYPRLAPTMEWDTAAAQIILEEAGGSVCIAGTNEPVRYNKEDLLNPHFIAKADEQ